MLYGTTMKRILVIDDDKFVRTSIRAVLESAGHEIAEAGDADTGINMQRSNPFDVVIVDLVMPHKEGFETIRELKTDYPDLPVIAISGGGAIIKKNFVRAAEVFGATATLEKPFGGDDLIDALNRVLSESSQKDQASGTSVATA